MENLSSEGGQDPTKEKNGKEASKDIKFSFLNFNMNLCYSPTIYCF